MKSLIYFFSGTGNTSDVVRKLAKRLDNCSVHRFTAEELREPKNATFSSDAEIIIWAFPTYSWGVPPVIRNIIKQGNLNFPENAINIAVTTCGDDIGCLPKMFRSDLHQKGLRAGAVFSVIMPNTYVMMKGFDVDPEKKASEKISNSDRAIHTIAEAINEGKISSQDDCVVKGRFAWFKTAVIYPWFVKYDMSPKGFNVDASLCITCGKCAKICPMDNIEYDAEGHPVWGNTCAFCTACYHICPTHAIGWKKTTKSKGQVKYFQH